ncbi:MAG: hypothetical protein LBE83_05495 [Propionibacteriaceae bacterium]|jgi:hypothetical protein|nr:hypothetical protein [Propionibacteriaceae bacterium]
MVDSGPNTYEPLPYQPGEPPPGALVPVPPRPRPEAVALSVGGQLSVAGGSCFGVLGLIILIVALSSGAVMADIVPALVMVWVGAFLFVPFSIAMARRQRLRAIVARNAPTPGEITGVETTGQGQSQRWRVRCLAYPPGSETPLKLFSTNLTTNPAPAIRQYGITHLPIYLDAAEPMKRHFVDVSGIVEKSESPKTGQWHEIDMGPAPDSTPAIVWPTTADTDNEARN